MTRTPQQRTPTDRLPADPAAPAAAALRTNQDLDPGRLREVFGIYPSGVVAVAALVDGVIVGLAASSFTSVSLDPPLVSFSIANTSRTWPDLQRAAHLGVTILADHHSAVARQLAGAVDQRFAGLPLTTTADGAVTIDDGLAQFETTIHDVLPAGDHTIVLLRLHAARRGAPADPSPLVFHRSRFGRLHPGEGPVRPPA
ncbi:putative oxidoreductase [Pilimelia anulata]|uniref:Putative oxidoreductase n=1 Tax=Pilimelia anulata TaxID=53371 RepID=A0A8J3BA92_9ACTN|nr:flavin reductase family protein [Pilimelia anulata]GGK04421.1 putative oxidoreductase [Pilimelia anulata]